jgi:hypothetical protein
MIGVVNMIKDLNNVMVKSIDEIERCDNTGGLP